MSDFVNPVTLALVPSANDMPAPWIVCTRADLTAWQVIASQYRKWVIDHIEEMTAPEKSTKDAALLTAQRDSAAAELTQVEGVQRAFMLSVLEEFNLHALKLNAILDAIDAAANLAALKTAVAAITDYPSRTDAQMRNTVRSKLGS